jgi:tetratricopeptide (TPR) repeat protein
MAMVHPVPMVARRLVVGALLAGWAAAFASAQAANPVASSAQSDSPSTPSSSSSSAHRRTGARSAHHFKVADGPAPELTQAEDFIQKKDYASAEPLLRKVVSNDPSNYAAWFDLGFAENGLGKPDDAIAAYRKSVAAKPDVFESNLNLGLQLAKAGRPDAEEFLRAATRLKPTSNVAEAQARAWLSLAHVLEPTKPDEAIAAYRQAALLEPNDPEPHLSAGLLLEKQEKLSAAEREYKLALALNPPSSDALTGLANVHMRQHHFPEAETELRTLATAHPDEAAPRIQLGRVLAAEGKNDDAIAELEAGAKLAPADMSLQRDLADLYDLSNKYDRSEIAYRALLTTSPNDAHLHQGLGKALLEQRKFPDAQKEFLIAVKLKPDLGTAYGDLAFAAGENKDYALSLKALDARVKFLPENAVTYFMRASAYDHLKDIKRAAVNYHLFLRTANGKYPDQEWQAKHRLIALEPKR